MVAIVLKAFSGLKPIIRPRLLGDTESQVARNVRLISGSLEPMRASTNLKSTTLSSPKTIYRYGSSATESNYWLEFANDTDVMRSPIPNDQYDRLYWADGISAPRYAPNSLVLTGAPYPGASYQLGIPAPSTKPTYSAYSTVAVYTPVTRDYVLTLFTGDKESAPTAAFSVQAVDGQKVAFTNLTTSNLGDTTITKKRLYRKVSGTFRRVAEIDLATTTYDDLATDASLASAATLPSGLTTAISAPTKAPAVSAPVATATPAGISRQYVYTIKSISISETVGAGESQYTQTNNYAESAASPPATVTADNTQTITLSGMVNKNGGTHFRVYRKDVGSPQYQLVAEIPVSQTSVTDPIASTVLGAVLAFDGPAGTGPTAAPGALAGQSLAITTVKRIYMLTFADAAGNQSAKGPSSAVIEVVNGATQVSISHSETINAGITKKRLYRQTVTVANGLIVANDANWKFVSESSANATSAIDAAPDSALTTGLSTTLQNLPPTPSGSPAINATIPAQEVPESRTYVYTYVSAYGEEGPPSDASAVIQVDGTKALTVELSGPPSGAFNITLKRLYRSSTVGTRAQFQFVAEVPVATSSYADTVDQAALGEVLMTDKWVAPPAGLKGLRMMANGAAVGFVGRTLHLSEPNLPHAWPHSYTIDDDIVGIAVFGQSVAVLTRSFPYLVQGADPSAMTPTRLEMPQACVSKRSILETGDGVIYASPDGLVSIGSSTSIVTRGILSREQWQAYAPSSMDLYAYNGRIHCFYATGADRGELIFDLSGQGAVLTTSNLSTTTAVTAGYFDPRTDVLYLAQGNAIWRFDQGAPLTATWRSKLFRLPHPQNLGVGQVRAANYPVTLRVYVDGLLKHTQTVTQSDHFSLPAGFRGLDWEFEVDTTSEVSEVILATTASELKAA
jgi:hypothetical protein